MQGEAERVRWQVSGSCHFIVGCAIHGEKGGGAVFFSDTLSLRSLCDIQVETSSGHLLHEAGSGRKGQCQVKTEALVCRL